MTARGAGRLYGIEALRGVAASLVVLFHVARHLKQNGHGAALAAATQFGHAGVDIFFVLSGFIILLVHREDIGRPERWAAFARSRFQRVWPIYWIASALTVVSLVAGGHAVPGVSRLFWSATLLPCDFALILAVAWTMQLEIIFYLLFGLAILHRRLGEVVMLLWLTAIVVHWAGVPMGWTRLPPACFGTFGLGFFMGLAAAFGVAGRKLPDGALVFGAGLACLAVAAMLEDFGIFDGFTPVGRFAYGIPAMLMIMGIVQWERGGGLRVPAWLSALGGASYSIYLFQFLFIGAAWKGLTVLRLDMRLPVFVSFAVLAGMAIAGGIAVSRFVEQPLLGAMRRRLR